MGYYEEVAGLGATPAGVVINGVIDSFNNCTGPGPARSWTISGALCHNLTIDATTGTGKYDLRPADPSANNNGCNNTNEMWASSQASPMRRVVVNGFTHPVRLLRHGELLERRLHFRLDVLRRRRSTAASSSWSRKDTINSTGARTAVWNQVFVGEQRERCPGPELRAGRPPASTRRSPHEPQCTEEEPFLYTDAVAT